MRALAPRERRLVAVALLVGTIALAWLGVIAPLVGGFQSRAEQRAQLIARYQTDQRLLAAIPTLRREADALKRSAPAYQITAPTQALAAEALKQRLTAALATGGGVVGAADAIQADVPLGWVSARADAVVTLTQLHADIRQLENEAPYVVVDYAALGADRAGRTGHAAPLDVRLQISALVHAAPVR